MTAVEALKKHLGQQRKKASGMDVPSLYLVMHLKYNPRASRAA